MTPEQEKRFDEFYSPTDASRDGNICIALPSKPAIKDFISSLLKEERERIYNELVFFLEPYDNSKWLNTPTRQQLKNLFLTPDTNQTEV